MDALIEVTRECMRVLKPTGSLFVNLGDKYSGAQAQNFGGTARAGADVWRRTDPKRTGIPNKSLMGIPWRYALRCIDDLGLILRAEIIWSKPNGLPESVTDRVRRSHETWFHFVMSPRYFSAVDEIREPHNSLTWLGREKQERANSDRNDGGKMANTANPLGKLPGSVWEVATEPLRVPDHLGIDHFAAFPTEWPKRIIQGWSPAGVCVECGEGRRPVVDRPSPVGNVGLSIRDDEATGAKTFGATSQMRLSGGPRQRWKAENPDTLIGYACACPEPTAPTTPAVILDPFGGTGTTAMVAKALGRTGISVDMSADYCRLASWRCNDRDQLAKVLGIDKAPAVHPEETSLLDLLGEDGGAA